MGVYAGIDFGTSGARIAVIDVAEQLLFEQSLQFSAGQNSEEQNWPPIWQNTLFDLIGQVPLLYRQNLAAIALDGTSSTVLLCDRDGHPLTAPLLYNDTSGATELSTLQQLFAQPPLRSAPGRGAVLSATSSLVKLLWWQQQPYSSQAHYLLHQADWLGFLLHGQLGISDYHNCLKLGYDVAQLCYPAWIEQLGVLPLLPEVVAPGSEIAPIQPDLAVQFSISPDCIVCAGTTDSIAAFLASGAKEPGEAVTSLGSTLVLKLLSTAPVENEQYGIYSHRLGDLWLVGGASNTGGMVLQKFFTTIEIEQLSQKILPDQESPLDYYPLVRPGDRFPVNDPQLLPRLEPRPSDPVAFLHGLLESMARIEAKGYQLLQDLGASRLNRVFTAGGGAKNITWTAIRNRHLKIPVVASVQIEAAYGTALLAKRSQE